MDRDITLITEQPCNVVVDNQTIATYSGTVVNTYKLVSNKYYLFETRDYSGLPTTLHCMTSSEITHLPSNYDFVMPIFNFMAIVSVLCIFYAAYRLFIYPFWRRRI